MSQVDVSAVLVNYNTAHLLDEVLGRLSAASAGLTVQTIVVDNASRDASLDVLRQRHPGLQVIANGKNVGFGRANNQALALLQGRYVLLLNTDAFVEEDTLRQTVAYMEADPACGILGVRLVGRDGVLQPSCRYFPTPFNVFLSRVGLARFFPGVRLVDDMDWDHASVRECDWVPGCYYLVRRELIERLGLFDPRYFLYYEEVDHCRTAKADGWKVVYFPHTTVIHIGGESAKSEGEITAAGRQISELQLESELLYFKKHHGLAGVALHMALSFVASVLLSAKSLLKGRGMRGVRTALADFANTCRFLKLTDWASRPTR